MAKIKLTKNELKNQREALKRYTRYLPTLELKKIQLVNEIRMITQQIEKIQDEIRRFEQEVFQWVAVFGEETFNAGISSSFVAIDKSVFFSNSPTEVSSFFK